MPQVLKVIIGGVDHLPSGGPSFICRFFNKQEINTIFKVHNKKQKKVENPNKKWKSYVRSQTRKRLIDKYKTHDIRNDQNSNFYYYSTT